MRDWINTHFPPPYRFLTGIFIVILADIFDVYTRLVEQMYRLLNFWEIKVVAGTALSLILSFHQSDYAYVAQGIFWLLVLDIITKWFAISNQYLIEQGIPQEDITTIDKFRGWIPAFRAGKITTANLGTGFLSKMIQYALLLSAAVMIDHAFGNSGIVLGMKAVTFTIGYTCYSEFLSIIENMRDSGVSHMDTLMDLLSSNILNKLKR